MAGGWWVVAWKRWGFCQFVCTTLTPSCSEKPRTRNAGAGKGGLSVGLGNSLTQADLAQPSGLGSLRGAQTHPNQRGAPGAPLLPVP